MGIMLMLMPVGEGNLHAPSPVSTAPLLGTRRCDMHVTPLPDMLSLGAAMDRVVQVIDPHAAPEQAQLVWHRKEHACMSGTLVSLPGALKVCNCKASVYLNSVP
jgi:hypothetical protein